MFTSVRGVWPIVQYTIAFPLGYNYSYPSHMQNAITLVLGPCKLHLILTPESH